MGRRRGEGTSTISESSGYPSVQEGSVVMEVRSVAEFQKNVEEYVSSLKQNRAPLLLTIDGQC